MAARSRGLVSLRSAASDLFQSFYADPKNLPGLRSFGRFLLNKDSKDLLSLLTASGARFLVVGAHALAVHDVPRATGDLYIWIDRDPANVDKVWAALQRFGVPMEALGFSRSDLAAPSTAVQIGLPPRRIDLLTDLTGVDFESAWGARVTLSMQGVNVPFLGREDLLKNKRSTGRTRDLADLEALGEKS